MASRVLLISVNQCDSPYPVFPLGLAHIDAALRNAGHTTRWLDLQAEPQPALGEIVREFKPECIGVSIRNIDDVVIRRRETYFGRLPELCAELRALTGCPIVLGGSGFSIFPEQLMEFTGADFGIHGEGETAFARLVTALETGRNHSTIPGLVFRDSERIVVNRRVARREVPENGSPERPEALTSYYLRQSSMLNVQTQRGCSHRCCYCTYPIIEGRTWRRREPEVVADEFADLERRGARYVFIVDSVFNSSPQHVASTCGALIAKGTKLQWGCFLRPKHLTRELMKLMRRAGLRHIEFGSDSFCDSVLAAYGKRLTFDDILQASEAARLEQIEFCHFLVCGGPGETEKTLRETFENSQSLDGSVILALTGMRVYPGTALFDRAVREGRFPRGTNFLEPQYYISPELTEQRVFELLHEFSRRSPNWIVGEPSPEYLKLAERLRAKGVLGPLWTHFATIQRLFSA